MLCRRLRNPSILREMLLTIRKINELQMCISKNVVIVTLIAHTDRCSSGPFIVPEVHKTEA